MWVFHFVSNNPFHGTGKRNTEFTVEWFLFREEEQLKVTERKSRLEENPEQNIAVSPPARHLARPVWVRFLFSNFALRL